MNQRLNLALLLLGAGIFVTLGDITLFHWARNNHWIHLALGLALNVVGITFYALTLRIESIGVATAIFLGINILAVSLAGFIFFSESIHLRGAIGMILIAFAIFLIEI
ncbi:hypothetical protein HOD38_03125 [archaeon]|jgi:multidrug transporter EmrE-like cation transporter|nr:hypothetical protein [archaeon]MBT4397231.1 hypothetical protein [archaeon]MBT4440611.1 hypothetical protein [archaeon]